LAKDNLEHVYKPNHITNYTVENMIQAM